MKRIRSAVFVSVSLVFLSGCASVLVEGPRPVGHPDREASSARCTTSKQWVAVDGILGTLFSVVATAALVSPDGWEEKTNLHAAGTGAVGGVMGVLGIVSAVRGNGKVNECLQAQMEQLRDAQEEAAASWKREHQEQPLDALQSIPVPRRDLNRRPRDVS